MSWRKGSTASVETSGGSNGSRGGGPHTKGDYPFALVLRLRVVQIVCGIAAVVMGSVAAIEERQHFNLSLGVPAGSITVLAAAWSIHRSVHHNAGGRRGGAWIDRILWTVACSLHFALLMLALRTILRRQQHGDSVTSDTSLWVATLQALLASGVIIAAAMGVRIRFIYGPTPTSGPMRPNRCPRSSSHTAVSMVPMASTYGGLCAANDTVSKSGDNDNETMEINVNDNKATFAVEEAVSPKSQIADSEKCENDRNLSTKKSHAGKALCDKENGASSNASANGATYENTENNIKNVKEDKKNLI
ncbi:uncharacterized protein LOC143918046 [Arctopsyche grandis]|uniref:uncharacterized protein LOC143918046 n=1 Tax=Arctopsyche grandis TaxID=121162 RepID=UPI00406D80B7